MVIKTPEKNEDVVKPIILKVHAKTLYSFDPKELDLSDKKGLPRFILALSHAYNDLQTTLTYAEGVDLLLEGDNETVSPWVGVVGGIKNDCFIELACCLNELRALLEEKRDLLKDNSEYRVSVSRLGELGSLARGSGWEKLEQQDGKTRSDLVKIRNNLGHHYAQYKLLAEGYLDHFSQVGPRSERAYFSLGKKPLETRFFFADAATQRAFYHITEDEGRWVIDLTGQVLGDLVALIMWYINTHCTVGEKLVCRVPKVGRNKLCPCGSGRKYKKCCGR